MAQEPHRDRRDSFMSRGRNLGTCYPVVAQELHRMRPHLDRHRNFVEREQDLELDTALGEELGQQGTQ